MFRTKTSQPRAYHIADRQPASTPNSFGLWHLENSRQTSPYFNTYSQRQAPSPSNTQFSAIFANACQSTPQHNPHLLCAPSSIFHAAKHAFSRCDRWSFATRSMVFRDAIHAKPQLETCLFAERRGEKAVPIPPKRHCGFMVRAKSRHKFLTKKHDRRVFVTIRLSQRH